MYAMIQNNGNGDKPLLYQTLAQQQKENLFLLSNINSSQSLKFLKRM